VPRSQGQARVRHVRLRVRTACSIWSFLACPTSSFSPSLVSSPKAVTSDKMNIDPDLLDDDLSSAMGTETLLDHDLMPDGLPTSSREPADAPH
jgi:hypothetical protein